MGKPRRLSKSDNIVIDGIAHMVLNIRQSNDGRVPHGRMEGFLNDLQSKGIDVTRDMLKARVKAIEKVLVTGRQQVPANINVDGITVASGVTPITPSAMSGSDTDTAAGVANSGTGTDSSGKPRGRPKGTTNKAKSDLKDLRTQLMDEVTVNFAELHKNKADKDSRLPKGTLKEMIKEKSKKLQVPDSVSSSISERTIRNRLEKNRKSLCPKHRGTPSPMAAIDQLVLPIVKGMARMMQPMKPPEVVALANSLIDGTVHQLHLIEWKKTHTKHQSHDQQGQVGMGWFHGFMQRHEDEVVTAKGRRFGANRSEWMHPQYLDRMFDAIYTIWCDAGVARKLVDMVAYDIEGNMVEINSPSQFGLPSSIEVLHKDHVLFGDECGINTCQKNDGHHGGARYVSEKGNAAYKASNTSDHRATILPFTALSGECVVLAVIFASANPAVPPLWHSGLDMTVDPIVDPDGQPNVSDRTLNYGPGKYMPSGPVCSFRGKQIPTLTYTSPNGSITDEILVDIFKTLDGLKVYERGEGLPVPCAVVDGHDSRLSTKFHDYITDPNHTWNFALGVPYLTHVWQVGDSSEQNGSFKIAFSKAKDALVAFKTSKGWDAKLDAMDIIPLINTAWEKSFARVPSNKKAIADRGWFPPTKNVLTDPKLFGNSDAAPVISSSAPDNGGILSNLDSVNMTQGCSASVFDQLLAHAAKKEGIKRRMEALNDGTRRQKLLDGTKRITAGLLIKQGIHSCNDPLVRAAFLEKEAKKKKEERLKKNKEKKKLLDAKEKVSQARAKSGPDPMNWTVAACRSLLKYKKRDGDKKMPDTQVLLRKLCVDRMDRASPDISPYVSDDDEEEEELQEIAVDVPWEGSV